jgi:tetratricopeptide (TPR) repeat protein
MFVAAAPTLAASTARILPVTDDWPIQEYGKRSLVDFGEGGIPPSLVAVDDIVSWCPGCFAHGRPTSRVDGLDTYLALTELAYRSTAAGASAAPLPRGRTILGSGYLGALVPESPALHQILTGATADAGGRYTRATELLEAGRFAEAIEAFRAVLRAVPDAVQAHNNLGVALASVGKLEEAIEAFEQALVLQPDYADARRNLAQAREQRRARPGSS